MAMIPCPACGQEVSDKAKKCIHCGEVLIEETKPQKFCAECGKEIPFEAEECPFCGCPVEAEKEQNIVVTQITDKAKANKGTIKKIAIAAAVIIVIILAVTLMGSSMNENEQLAYQCATEMKSMMKDPDSFKLYDEMMILKEYNDDGELENTYTIFKYGGANGYGAITTDEAIFKNGEYVMDYADEPDEDASNYAEQLETKISLLAYQVTGGDEKWERIDLDIEKIKKKMGLE